MSALTIIALLVSGVIIANISKSFFPNFPNAFTLIGLGIVMSFIPSLEHFSLEPEYFMLLILAPIMFMDGQEESLLSIKSHFRVIIELSVTLAIFTAILVGLLTNRIEEKWTLPLSIALAAIVVPTDAVAVKSITSNLAMPKGVNKALGLESLFNDATGLVLLDFALTVIPVGSFTWQTSLAGIGKFLIVAGGGVLVGIILSVLIIQIRFQLNMHINNPQTTTIPINIMTPFVIFLVAEHMGFSGILAVVAAGIVHNWEGNRMRLAATEVRIVTQNIWETLTSILNEVVFLILGISLPSVWQDMQNLGWENDWKLFALSLAIYTTMVVVRYLWVRLENSEHMVAFFGKDRSSEVNFNAKVFGISGVHGTVTLAMAFSLPTKINGETFIYRTDLIIIASMVILISMVMASVILPKMLPVSEQSYTEEELDNAREQMVDFATLKVQQNIPDRAVRESLVSELFSQKMSNQRIDEAEQSKAFPVEAQKVADFISDFLITDAIVDRYSPLVITRYGQMIERSPLSANWHEHPLQHFYRRLQHSYRRFLLKLGLRRFLHGHRGDRLKKQFENNPTYKEKYQQFKDFHEALLALNQDVMKAADQFLNEELQDRLDNNNVNNTDIYMARRSMDQLFQYVERKNHSQVVKIPNNIFVQVFQYEYDYVQDAYQHKAIKSGVANTLFNEISQAQSLQMMQSHDDELMVEEKAP
ncbi:cation:proton antiporter [Eupransor demetentiae]|uniref:NhaP-type Na+/H+ or K+/H+ antiporter (NhaP) n=1 Tax=Eupransor demetentiae TaxID=3109584 RepID=A0ABP0EMK5_9LACO|nr:NhaP-type Na+/H+ or K+/H+ antiporter (NhaP) [Lactobacillaceae bacterium LMG 33000]